MVPWASPAVIKRAAVRAVLGPLFGRFADKRDVVALADPDPAANVPREDPGDGWFDFVADTGEGFDSTYTVARIASADALPAGVVPAERDLRLPRGRILVFGGDEVYPYAEPWAYRDRLQAPWNMALPRGGDDVPRGSVYAIPGNHDWYDGLSSFLRVFEAGKTVGSRRVEQQRSYF